MIVVIQMVVVEYTEVELRAGVALFGIEKEALHGVAPKPRVQLATRQDRS